MKKRNISRREFLRVSTTAVAGGLTLSHLPALASTAKQSMYSQSPMLEELVASGALPSLEERLPLNPLVLPVVEEIGTYGGDLDTVGERAAPLNGYNMGNYAGQTLVFYAWAGMRGETGEIVSNVAESFETNDDSTHFTIHLREGLKWSDGVPFTTEDILFYWNDVLANDELTPAKPEFFRKSDGSLMDINAPDAYTVEFTSDVPQPWFWDRLASLVVGGSLCRHPKHYMSQFHADYATAEDLQARLDAEGFTTWTEMYGVKTGNLNIEGQPDKPYLQAWVPRKVAPENPPLGLRAQPLFLGRR